MPDKDKLSIPQNFANYSNKFWIIFNGL